MSLIGRRSRPIPRDEGKVRDARLFIVATEDTYAPKQYFTFFSHSRIHVEVLETVHGAGNDPKSVVNRLMKFAEDYQIKEDDQLWALLDTDHWIEGSHKPGLIEAIKDARQRGYRVAMSNPCFDLWLLLHHEELAGAMFDNCDAVGARIRQVKGEFNKKNLKSEHYPLPNIAAAIDRAKALEKDLGKADSEYWPEDTACRVYFLMDELRSAGLLLKAE
jgi:hypothetical protein